MSKLLKVIVNTLLLLAILSAGALVIPPFAGITTLVSDGMGNTNISRGAVTYAKKTDTSSVATGDKILVDDNSGKYIYTIQSLDTAAGTASVKNVISGDATEITVRETVSKVIVTIPVIGFLSMAAQSREGIMIIGLAILFLVILFILSEVWKRDEEEDEEEEEEEEEEEGEEGPEYDEHVWLSLKNAVALTNVLADNIQALDPDNKSDYMANAGKYVDELNDLDGRYELTVSKGKRQAILFGDRFPFRYMADDYGLTYYAAFVGCSAESEASFETITFLAQKVDELKLPVILTIEGADHSIAESIKKTTDSKNQEILTMNSMQSVTAEDVADGETYLNVMEDNLNVLSQALN